MLALLAKPACRVFCATALCCLAAVGSAAGLDLNQLIKQYAAASSKAVPQQAAILVSFSIPPDSLQSLATQAGQLGVRMVLRGLADHSVAATTALIYAADPQQAAVWEIDPSLFTQFEINAVPALALWNEEEVLIAHGEVGLDYALRHLAQGNTHLAAYADELLAQLAKPQ